MVEFGNGVGDRLRLLGRQRSDASALFHGINWGTRSKVLETKDERGLEAILCLSPNSTLPQTSLTASRHYLNRHSHHNLNLH